MGAGKALRTALLPAAALALAAAPFVGHGATGLGPATTAVDPSPPSAPVKLVFVHHSSGENWLADDNGGLGLALRDNHYFVSDTNYGWGPADLDAGYDAIGDHTDIGHWYTWFAGPHRGTYVTALLAESEQHSWYTRLASDPGGANRVVMFKSCFPNSHLGGNPSDPPANAINPLRGEGSSSPYMTVGNAKGIYNDLLTFFATRQDVLWIAITAPPLMASSTDPQHAANARAFNRWLVTQWLAGYSHANVAVLDFYNVLTSNGGSWDLNDLSWSSGNHHRVRAGTVEYVTDQGGNTAAYPDGDGDDHPSTAGNRKATGELVALVNAAYHRWAGDGPSPTPSPTATPRPTPTAGPAPRVRRHVTRPAPGDRLLPSDLAYRGAFRLPDTGIWAPSPQTFEYGGEAMAFRPGGDPSGPNDGYPGSLFVTGFDVDNYVAEISIPAPLISATKDPEDLPEAGILQPFADVRGGLFEVFTEMPRVALLVLTQASTGEKLHLAWGQHLQEGSPALPSHGWASTDLAHPDTRGAWYVGDRSPYSVNGYMLEIPAAWADAHAGGRRIGTGRYRDGGWSGRGPALFAIAPWLSGDPPAAGTHLSEVPLLLYSHTRSDPPDTGTSKLRSYQHADEWEGGAWLSTARGAEAVVFAGTKGTGTYYWYGWLDPADPTRPCVELSEGGMCYQADGSPCPAELVRECAGHTSDRGWWSSAFAAQMLFYDGDDLADVAAGQRAPGDPQPYAVMSLDPYLLLPDPCVEPATAGTGAQRRFRIGEIGYDRAHGLLYLLEHFADGAKPVVHVFAVR